MVRTGHDINLLKGELHALQGESEAHLFKRSGLFDIRDSLHKKFTNWEPKYVNLKIAEDFNEKWIKIYSQRHFWMKHA